MINKVLKIYLVNPPDDMREKLTDFFSSLKIDLEFVDSSSNPNLTVDFQDAFELCDRTHLHVPGKIPCSLAFEVSEQIALSRQDFGKLLDLLGIKISACQLGCFK